MTEGKTEAKTDAKEHAGSAPAVLKMLVEALPVAGFADPWGFAKAVLTYQGETIVDVVRNAVARRRPHRLQILGHRLQLVGRALHDLGEIARDPSATADALAVGYALVTHAVNPAAEPEAPVEEKPCAASGNRTGI